MPNGGARRPAEGAIMKAEGVTAGVADLILLFPSSAKHALLIEMKTPDGRQSPAQKQWQLTAEQAGYRYTICRSVEDFVNEIRTYLHPTRTAPAT